MPSLLPYIDREIVERHGLVAFVRLAWHVVEPAIQYRHNWHIELISRYLEQTLVGECRRLVINVPPGFTKSLLVSVLFPAWAWTIRPDWRIMASSHDGTLAHRDADRLRDLVRSQWYQDRWGDVCKLDSRRTKADTKGLYYTTATGMRMSSTVGGKAVGWHAHCQICDDPIKPADASAATSAAIIRVNDWWRNTMASRLLDPETAVRIIIMQRVHEDDLSGLCITDGWEHVCLPMTGDLSHPYRHAEDLRKDGDLLWPARYSRTSVNEIREAMGPQVAAAQLEQLPAPPGGSVFRNEWLSHRWDDLPRHYVLCSSWDHSFGSLKGSASYVVGQVWAFDGAYSYLVDQIRDRMEFPQMLQAMRAMKAKHPKCLNHLVEAKASGPAIEQMLRAEMAGIVMISADASTGGKLARANSVTGMFSSGHVALPSAPWVGDLVVRFKRFTGAGADVSDEIDACTQALTWYHGSGVSRFVRCMDSIRSKAA